MSDVATSIGEGVLPAGPAAGAAGDHALLPMSCLRYLCAATGYVEVLAADMPVCVFGCDFLLSRKL